ncbi:class I SAM-dependent methyltransferase [Dyella halodurans]|uniref:Class I SAM-dependent methyltransferase n=1 Tax=Dyella halodurans TaxID=1920171 RepID=A0ABV9BW92_9GAMM|nr:class I SAM-dependent methyltransferase [Dyella halodurans]
MSASILDTYATNVLNAANQDSPTFATEMTRLVRALRDYFLELGPVRFREIADALMNHPVKALMHSDPFVWRTYSKPRGYAGDAVMLDYIYGPQFANPSFTSAAAQRLYLFSTNSQACQAVRYRREQLSIAIDRAAVAVECPRILALACGHLRELSSCHAIAMKRPVQIVAIDQDKLSLDQIERDYGAYNIELIPAGVRDILKGNIKLNDFDLVYAAGLFDYLPTEVAKPLINVLFESLNPGGHLLYANFMPEVEDCGYMESFMDWHLIFRSKFETLDLAHGIDRNDVKESKLWTDPLHCMAFVDLTKSTCYPVDFEDG